MKLVLDASVILKWLLDDPEQESDTGRATVLLEAVLAGKLEALQPLHWLAEVAAVLARLTPATAIDDLQMLHALELSTTGEVQVLRRACRLAIETGQHVFDTLYHAVALETDNAVLITADTRYLRHARHLGRIVALRDWEPTG